MTTVDIISAVGALAVAMVGVVTYVAAQRANRAQANARSRAVDAEAYIRAREIYEAALAAMRGELEAVRADLREARVDIRELRRSNEKLHEELIIVRAELARYKAAGR